MSWQIAGDPTYHTLVSTVLKSGGSPFRVFSDERMPNAEVCAEIPPFGDGKQVFLIREGEVRAVTPPRQSGLGAVAIRQTFNVLGFFVPTETSSKVALIGTDTFRFVNLASSISRSWVRVVQGRVLVGPVIPAAVGLMLLCLMSPKDKLKARPIRLNYSLLRNCLLFLFI